MSVGILTGMVYQRTKKGPNYICLGSAMVEGERKVISTKNGNINFDGTCRRLKGKKEVRIEAHDPRLIARIHDVRDVNLQSVFENGNTSAEEGSIRRLTKKPLKTSAELPDVRRLK